MNKNFKRILAYMVDMVIVSIIVYGLTNIKQINFQLENYKKTYKQYEKTVEKYQDLEDEYEDAKEDYEDKLIDKKEYQEKKQVYNDYKATYSNKVKKYNYELSKNSVISTLISIAIIIAYFGIFQFSMGGQTLGKKLMHLKVVKNKEGNLNILNYLIRCVILNGVIANVALLICVGIFNAGDFYNANYIITNAQSVLEIIILIMIFMTADGRGLHDYLAQTKVIEIDKEGKEVEYIPPTKKREE